MQASLEKAVRWITQQQTILCPDQLPIASNPFSDHSVDFVVNYSGNKRLGFVYQALCKQLFEQSEQYQVVAEEIQLIANRRTLGAIDFIVQHQSNYQHWEVAIKFYLLHDDHWYGPDSRDRLDLKLNHMLNHQLAMSATDTFKQQYPYISNITSHLFMQGRLYINPFEQNSLPQHCLGHRINQHSITGFWCYQHQWKQITEPLYRLDKINWIAGNVGQAERYILPNNPLQYTVHCQDQTGQFWMIVPDNWPQIKQP